MIALLLFTLSVSVAIQAAFFAFAATLRTDKVTDLSYGLTFVVLAIGLPAGTGTSAWSAIALAGMVVAWGVRLAGYLFVRILHMGRDRRFDGIRERFWKFLQFWFFQGLVVWTVMLPVILWFGRDRPASVWTVGMTVGAVVWLAGFLVETVADAQKFRSKRRPAGRTRWMSTGLWRYSRHPNYFGELLCWWGVFIFVAGDLGSWAALAVIGPLALTYVLLFVTGIPTLDRSALAKWGDDPAYLEYRRRTNRLLPWPPGAPATSRGSRHDSDR
jgi:steroid 5-alpha reductase family enzyme